MIVASTPCSDFLSGMVLKWMPCCPVVGQPPMPNSVAEAPFEHENCCCSFFSPIWHTKFELIHPNVNCQAKRICSETPPASRGYRVFRAGCVHRRKDQLHFCCFTATYTQNCLGAHGELTCYDVALLKRQNETTQQVSFPATNSTVVSLYQHRSTLPGSCAPPFKQPSRAFVSLVGYLHRGEQQPPKPTIHNTSVRHIWLRAGSLGEDLNLERRTTLSRRAPTEHQHGDCADYVCVKLHQPFFSGRFLDHSSQKDHGYSDFLGISCAFMSHCKRPHIKYGWLHNN